MSLVSISLSFFICIKSISYDTLFLMVLHVWSFQMGEMPSGIEVWYHRRCYALRYLITHPISRNDHWCVVTLPIRSQHLEVCVVFHVFLIPRRVITLYHLFFLSFDPS